MKQYLVRVTSFVLPAVLMLIVQQALVLGIGLSAGTARESNRFQNLVPPDRRYYHGMFRVVFGKAMCYLMIYILMGAWLTIIVPRLFHFPCLAHWQDLLAIMLPYTLACIFFGMSVSCLVRYRENAMLIMVFVSVPLALMIVFMKKNAVTVTCKLLTHSEMSVTPKNVLIKMNQNFC